MHLLEPLAYRMRARTRAMVAEVNSTLAKRFVSVTYHGIGLFANSLAAT